MDSRALAAFLSSLISSLLLLLFSSSSPLFTPNSNSNGNLFPLLHHFLSTSEIATSVSLLSISRKRKRTLNPESDSDDDEPGPGLVQLRRVNSGIPQNPDSFKLCFRMSCSTFEWLSGLLEPLLECRDPIGSTLDLSAETRLGIGLFRLSTGADYPEISRRFRVSEPTAQFCVKQLCRVLCTNFRFWVGFPTQNELESVSAAFKNFTGLPNCCGVIDCIRFKIKRNNLHNSSPKDQSEEESIAAQIVVDSSSRILSIIAGFRGNKDHSSVLKSSSLYKDIEIGRLLNSQQPIDINGVSIPQYLVGDNGYPLLPWLIVPFVEATTGPYEEKFNASLHLMRVRALRAIASLKNWGVLSKPIEADFKTAVACIGACSILHNVLLMREDFSALSDELDDYSLFDQSSKEYFGDASLEENSIDRKGSEIRSALATRAREGHVEPISTVKLQPQ